MKRSCLARQLSGRISLFLNLGNTDKPVLMNSLSHSSLLYTFINACALLLHKHLLKSYSIKRTMRDSMRNKTKASGPEEMTQLTACPTLAEDLSTVPSTFSGWFTTACNSSSKVTQCFWSPRAPAYKYTLLQIIKTRLKSTLKD